MSNLATVIQLHTGLDIDEKLSKCFDSQTGIFTVNDCASTIVDDIMEALQSTPAVAREMAEKMSKIFASSEITKRKTLPWFKDGMVDFFGFQSMIISVSHGEYINLRDAGVEALIVKIEEQDNNIADVIAKRDLYVETVTPIIEYMKAYDIDSAGEAIQLMGL